MKQFAIFMVLVAAGFVYGQFGTVSAQTSITDPVAIRVANEVVRPLAESQRKMYFQCVALIAQYPTATLQALFPAGGGAIEDGRENEGVSRLVSDDARRNLLFAITYRDAYETAGASDMMKPCIRQIEVN